MPSKYEHKMKIPLKIGKLTLKSVPSIYYAKIKLFHASMQINAHSWMTAAVHSNQQTSGKLIYNECQLSRTSLLPAESCKQLDSCKFHMKATVINGLSLSSWHAVVFKTDENKIKKTGSEDIYQCNTKFLYKPPVLNFIHLLEVQFGVL